MIEFPLQSSALPEDARVCGFQCHERISEPFRLDIYFVTLKPDSFDQADAIGGKVTLEVATDKDAPFLWHGVLTSVRLLGHDKRGALYHAVVVPKMHWLSQTRHSRMFTKVTIIDVFKEVLEENGLSSSDYDFRLDHTYEEEEHICQFHESDLDFLHRWMEAEGMYYFFEHGDDGEVLVVTDHKSMHDPLRDESVRYYPGTQEVGEKIGRMACEYKALPAVVKIADYDYGNPNLDLATEADVSAAGTTEVSAHAQRAFTPAMAQHYAKVRAEELLCREVTIELAGTRRHVRSGYLLEVEDHPRGELNQKYLITEIQHRGGSGGWSPDGQEWPSYDFEAEAIPADTQFRPRRETAWPHIYGIEGAIVDGEATSDYAQIDDQGRYNIRFYFDEASLEDGKASTRVRMAQPHGGTTEGWHFPLRKGTEVMVAFQGGDPDRPAIVGVAPNAQKPSPITKSNHSSNMIRTGGLNRLEIEDLEGTQRMTWYSPTKNTMLRMGAPNDDYHCRLWTEGNTKFYIHQDLHVFCRDHKQEWVEGTTDEEYKDIVASMVDQPLVEKYHQKKTETVGDQVTEHYKATQETTVTALCKEDYKSHDTNTQGARTETVSSPVTEEYGTLTTTVTNKVTDQLDAKWQMDVGAAETHTIGGRYTRNITGDHNFTDKGATNTSMGSHIKLVGGLTHDTTMGFKMEVLNALKAEMFVGLKVETGLSVRIDLVTTMNGVGGLEIDKNEAITLKAIGTKLKSCGVKVMAGKLYAKVNALRTEA